MKTSNLMIKRKQIKSQNKKKISSDQHFILVFFLSHSLSLSLSLSVSVSVSLYLSLSRSISISIYLYISLCISISLYYISLSISLGISLYVYVSRNEIWHWTNEEIGVAVQSWLWGWVELVAW